MKFLLPLLLAASCLFAVEQNAARSPAEETEYAQKINARADDIVKALALPDAASAATVHEALLAQYRALDAWQRENEAPLKELKKASHSQDKATAEKAQTSINATYSSRKALRERFLQKLGAVLTPAQVEQVKDKLTYNKVQVTFNAYCQQYPTLNDEQKAKILGWLKEAREEAIDGGSSEEKSDIFNKFKGRINNYLVKQGLSNKKK
jgi:hypothetical protein